jgi:hypothetical protein
LSQAQNPIPASRKFFRFHSRSPRDHTLYIRQCKNVNGSNQGVIQCSLSITPHDTTPHHTPHHTSHHTVELREHAVTELP